VFALERAGVLFWYCVAVIFGVLKRYGSRWFLTLPFLVVSDALIFIGFGRYAKSLLLRVSVALFGWSMTL